MPADASSLSVGGVDYAIWRVGDVSHLPFSLRILLENVLRTSSDEDAQAVREWVATDEPSQEIGFTPARVLLQDFTGVPAGSALVGDQVVASGSRSSTSTMPAVTNSPVAASRGDFAIEIE